jgi:hypothetical protein
VSIPADTLSDNLAGELHTVKSLETIAIVLFSDRSSDTTMRTVFRLLPSDVTVVFFGVRGTEIERPSLNLENLTGMYYYFRGLGSVEIDQAPKATEISFSVDGDCICRGVAGSIEVVSARSVDIRNCPMLTAVEFGSCDQMNRIVLSDCAKLQSLELGFPGVEPNTLELSQLPNLTVASVDRLNRSLARTLSALPSLESIEIYDFQECERGAIAELGAAPNLHRLTVIRPSADALDVLGEELCALASAPAVRILVTDGRGNGNFANTGYDMANFPREAVDRIRNLYPHWDIR